jgi:hypothetical protein
MTIYLVKGRTAEGEYEAADEQTAIEAFIRDAGYADAQHGADMLDISVEDFLGQFTATEMKINSAGELVPLK